MYSSCTVSYADARSQGNSGDSVQVQDTDLPSIALTQDVPTEIDGLAASSSAPPATHLVDQSAHGASLPNVGPHPWPYQTFTTNQPPAMSYNPQYPYQPMPFPPFVYPHVMHYPHLDPNVYQQQVLQYPFFSPNSHTPVASACQGGVPDVLLAHQTAQLQFSVANIDRQENAPTSTQVMVAGSSLTTLAEAGTVDALVEDITDAGQSNNADNMEINDISKICSFGKFLISCDYLV